MVPEPIEPTDTELAYRVVKGPDSAPAFDVLYARHAIRLLAYLRDRLPKAVNEIAREAWTRVFEQFRKGEAGETIDFRALLFRIAASVGTDLFRSTRREFLGPDEDTPDPRKLQPKEAMIDAEKHDVFQKCLAKLEPDYRVLITVCCSGERREEIALRLGLSLEVVDARKSRAMAALRACADRHLPKDSQLTPAIAVIPDDIDRLPRWLEERVVGGELRGLVAELAGVHGAKQPPDSVRNRLGPNLPTLLTGGLITLPGPAREKVVQYLLRQPFHLLELQKIILVEGGPYWDAIPKPSHLLANVSHNKERISDSLFSPVGGSTATTPQRTGAPARQTVPELAAVTEPATAIAPVYSAKNDDRWYRSPWVLLAVTAASVCIVTFAATRLLAPPTPTTITTTGPARGWAKPGGIPSETDRAKYLTALAERGNEWFDERPTDAASLARRLSEFRQGYSALLLAPHEPLSPNEREELRKRCRDAAKKFDDFLIRVETNKDNPQTLLAVRTEADAVVRELIEMLQKETRNK